MRPHLEAQTVPESAVVTLTDEVHRAVSLYSIREEFHISDLDLTPRAQAAAWTVLQQMNCVGHRQVPRDLVGPRTIALWTKEDDPQNYLPLAEEQLDHGKKPQKTPNVCRRCHYNSGHPLGNGCTIFEYHYFLPVEESRGKRNTSP